MVVKVHLKSQTIPLRIEHEFHFRAIPLTSSVKQALMITLDEILSASAPQTRENLEIYNRVGGQVICV